MGNHFIVPKFYVYVEKDQHFPGFRINIGEGSFKLGNDFRDTVH